jgi:hypothetical protein
MVVTYRLGTSSGLVIGITRMDMSELWEQTITLSGESWWLSAAFWIMSTLPTGLGDSPGVDPGLFPTGVVADFGDGFWKATPNRQSVGEDAAMGSIRFTNAGAMTKIEVRASEQFAPFWKTMLNRLERFATTADRVRRYAGYETIDAAIEYYYRSRARGQHVTLKDIAEASNISYDYLRKRKSIYDRSQKKVTKLAQ